MLLEHGSIEKVLEYIFDGMDLNILEEVSPEFKCNCTREKVESVLISIGEKDLEEIYNDGKEEEIKCNFCNASYKFSHEEIGEILNKARQK